MIFSKKSYKILRQIFYDLKRLRRQYFSLFWNKPSWPSLHIFAWITIFTLKLISVCSLGCNMCKEIFSFYLSRIEL